jgi:plasmid stabilization system protein ParE
MKVRYTRRAFADRESIFDYLEKKSPAAAREVQAFIDTQITTLETLPEGIHL